MPNRLSLAAAASVLALAAAGCHQQNQQAASSNAAPPPLAALPLATGAAPTIAPAPALEALPPAAPVRVARIADPGQRYAFADRAWAANAGFGDAPPDYTFDYGGGQRPWVWRGDDGTERVAEALPGGGYRYYYYEPGADEPYLVRDPDYSYGYEGGALVVVYDSRGHLVPEFDARQTDGAARYYARARGLHRASLRSQREAVAQAHWAAQRRQIEDERAQWAANQRADDDWQAYHNAHVGQDEDHWAAERYRREMAGAAFARTINDAAQAQRDMDSARKAQARATATGQLPPPRGGPASGNPAHAPGQDHFPGGGPDHPGYAGPSPGQALTPGQARPPRHDAPHPGFVTPPPGQAATPGQAPEAHRPPAGRPSATSVVPPAPHALGQPSPPLQDQAAAVRAAQMRAQAQAAAAHEAQVKAAAASHGPPPNPPRPAAAALPRNPPASGPAPTLFQAAAARDAQKRAQAQAAAAQEAQVKAATATHEAHAVSAAPPNAPHPPTAAAVATPHRPPADGPPPGRDHADPGAAEGQKDKDRHDHPDHP